MLQICWRRGNLLATSTTHKTWFYISVIIGKEKIGSNAALLRSQICKCTDTISKVSTRRIKTLQAGGFHGFNRWLFKRSKGVTTFATVFLEKQILLFQC